MSDPAGVEPMVNRLHASQPMLSTATREPGQSSPGSVDLQEQESTMSNICCAPTGCQTHTWLSRVCFGIAPNHKIPSNFIDKETEALRKKSNWLKFPV